jgi:hypothetical protein
MNTGEAYDVPEVEYHRLIGKGNVSSLRADKLPKYLEAVVLDVPFSAAFWAALAYGLWRAFAG